MRFAAALTYAAAAALTANMAHGSDLPELAQAMIPPALAPHETSLPADIRPALAKPVYKPKMDATFVTARPAWRGHAVAAESAESGSLRVFAAAKAAERSVPEPRAEITAAAPPAPALPTLTIPPQPPEPKPEAAPPAEARKGLAADYCAGIADAAGEARAAWQVKKIAELEKELTEQIRKLDEKKQEYQDWFQKQEAQRRKAEDSVVAIFSRMRPDAAAAQLSVMEEASASSMLAKMNARVASVILNEMTPAKAARLADSMTAQSREADKLAARGANP